MRKKNRETGYKSSLFFTLIAIACYGSASYAYDPKFAFLFFGAITVGAGVFHAVSIKLRFQAELISQMQRRLDQLENTSESPNTGRLATATPSAAT